MIAIIANMEEVSAFSVFEAAYAGVAVLACLVADGADGVEAGEMGDILDGNGGIRINDACGLERMVPYGSSWSEEFGLCIMVCLLKRLLDGMDE